MRSSYRSVSKRDVQGTQRILPSTNPIKSPSPDVLSRKEKIAYTQSPSKY